MNKQKPKSFIFHNVTFMSITKMQQMSKTPTHAIDQIWLKFAIVTGRDMKRDG
jgi:hypothetical protein